MGTVVTAGASARRAVVELPRLDARPENLTDMVFEAIRDSIVNQTLAPGSRISEARLAAQLQVSKTPVRESLLRLRHVGLVESTERGLQVIRPSIAAIRNAYELRSAIERSAAHLAARRAHPGICEQLLAVAERSLTAAAAGDGPAFRSDDGIFHRLVAAGCGNAVLASAVDDSLILTAVLRERDMPATGDSVSCAGEHIAIARAICGGRADEAAKRNAEHVLHVMSLVLGAHSAMTAAWP